MKYLITLAFFLCSLVIESRPLTIINESNIPIDVIIWKDSKIIHHHVMNPNDQVTVEDVGHGLLLQYFVTGLRIQIPKDLTAEC